MYKTILLLCAFAALSYAQITAFGPCPNIPAKANFTGAKFAGKWYMYSRYLNPEDGGGKCMTSKYVLVGNSTFNYTKSVLAVSDSKETKVTGQVYFSASLTSDAFLTFKINGASSGVNVIDTDYTTYSVLYACQNFFFYHTKYVWVYTRSRFSLLLNMKGPNAILDRYGLNRDSKILVRSDQINCPFLR